MDRNRDKNKNQSTDSLDIYAAKLTYIGTSLSTLGDGIQTIAAGLALEALLNSKKENSNDQAKQNTKMKQQIDQLISELQQIKRFLR
ncbi:translation initiation factor 2 [Lysinibacillus xylanilyticus]|uniref:Translation initiation factor 2 n=1 Tax=Lysinibacillus xylanilyticus TaxID=582475 RepID=A0ABT4EYW6_9BACI|nr:translation initiation factor 2 [Lysinibacillus xylanilyticus]MCY9549481.1 translation initiation factor 2 [Lysinibacillus xylanilyticus]MED3803954.1 translation initiation factor 2 [Lysinibacillus xylanilyticus]